MKNLSFLLVLLILSLPVWSYTWDKVYKAKRWGGEVKAEQVAGSVSINGQPGVLQGIYVNQVSIELGKQSYLLLSMTDGNLFYFSGPGVYSMEIGTKVSVLVKILYGRVSGIRSSLSRRRIMLQGVNGNFGIKNPLLFALRVYESSEQTMLDPEGNAVLRMPNITEHICALGGAVDYIGANFARVEKIENTVNLTCEYVRFENALYDFEEGSIYNFLREEAQLLLARAGKNAFDLGTEKYMSIPARIGEFHQETAPQTENAASEPDVDEEAQTGQEIPLNPSEIPQETPLN